MKRKIPPAPEMRRSWLVQRLSKPRKVTGPLAVLGDNPFSFGGGLVNGGLSKDAMSLIRPIMSFEYMGAAEFEFGAVPEAFQMLARYDKALQANAVTFLRKDVAPHWDEPKDYVPEGEVTVYALSHRDHWETVQDRILAWAAGSRGDEYATKERVGLSDVLRPSGKYVPDTCGWLELDNGFMFFTDRDMWIQACALFGVERDAEVPA